MVRSKLNPHKTSFSKKIKILKKFRSFEHDRDISGVNIYFNSMIKITPLIILRYYCSKMAIFGQNRSKLGYFLTKRVF